MAEVTNYTAFPMFKGLQRPLELMGLQGRYIGWGAATAGGAVVGFILGYMISGFGVGLLILVSALASGGSLIMVKQKRGLHTKKVDKGVFVYSRSRKF